MARLWMSGFGLNSTTASMEFSSISGTVSIQSAIVRVGGFAARFNPTAAAAFIRFHGYAANQSAVGYMRAYIYIATMPGANTTIMRFADIANNACAQIRLTSTGTLVLLDAGNGTVGSASSALSTNTWYMVELSVDASATPGTVTGRLNGTQFATGANSANSPWARYLIGPVVTATCDMYAADWAVNDGSGSAQNSWPGAGAVLTLPAGGDGDNSQWRKTDNVTSGDATSWQLVRDIPPDDSTTYTQTLTATAVDSFTCAPHGQPGGTVACVMVGIRLSNTPGADATTSITVQLKKVSGSTLQQSTAIIPNSTTWVTNAAAEPRNYPIIAHTDPTGGAWTLDTITSMQIGYNLSAAGTNRGRVTAIWALVDINPAGTFLTPAHNVIRQAVNRAGTF